MLSEIIRERAAIDIDDLERRRMEEMETTRMRRRCEAIAKFLYSQKHTADDVVRVMKSLARDPESLTVYEMLHTREEKLVFLRSILRKSEKL